MANGFRAPRAAGGGKRITARAGFGVTLTRHNKRMHATRDTHHVINYNRAGGRVMRGVRRAQVSEPKITLVQSDKWRIIK